VRLAASLGNLVHVAEDAGAHEVTLESVIRGERVEITVAHDGAPLTPDVASLVFDRSHDDERAAIEAGAAPVGLLAALDSIEAMAGSLAHLPRSGRAAFVVSLPRAAEHETSVAGTPQASAREAA
jgi:signal transduction histidine kinase